MQYPQLDEEAAPHAVSRHELAHLRAPARQRPHVARAAALLHPELKICFAVCAERDRTASSRASRSARDTTRLPRPVSSDADVPGAVVGFVSRAQNALLEYVLSVAEESSGRPLSLEVFPVCDFGWASVAGLRVLLVQ